MRTLPWLLLILILLGLPVVAQAQESAGSPSPLRVAIDRAYSPYSLIGPTGQPTGLAVEIWRAWGQATGTPIEFIPSGWEGTLEALRSGKADVHFGMFKNASRAEWVDFAEPIHQIHTALFFRAGADKPLPLEDLAGEKVGVWAGSYQQQFLQDKYPKIEAIAIPDGKQLILKLLNGEIRAILNEVPSVEADLAAYGIRGVLTRREKSLFSNYLQPAVRKGENELLERINEGFRKVPITRLHELETLWISSASDHFYAGASGDIQFSLEEEAWIVANPVVRLAVTTFIQPVDVLDDAGNYKGLNADLISLLNKKLGINIVPEFFDSWGGVVDAAVNGMVDGAFSLSITPEREKTVQFTKPYAFDPIIAIVPRSRDDIAGWKDLEGKTVSVVKGASIVEEIRAMIGSGELIEVEAETDGLKAVSNSEVDAHVSWLIPYGNAQRVAPVDGLKIALTRNSEGGTLRIGIHKDRPELYTILRKGLNAISRKEMTEVRNAWLFPEGVRASVAVELNPVEQAWLRDNPIIHLAVLKDYPPFDFTNENGKHIGLHSDLLRLMNKNLGINAVTIPFETWKEAYDTAVAGEVEGIMSLSWTQEREKTFAYSTAYYYTPADLVTRDTLDAVEGWQELDGRTIWIQAQSSLLTKIKEELPGAKILEAASEKIALEKLASGQGDAFVAWISTSKAKLKEMGLKVSAEIDTRQGELAIGTHLSRPIVAGIIQKGLNSIPAQEMAALRDKWLFSDQQQAELTAQERAWMDRHTVKVGVEQWPPVIFKDKLGNPQGMASGFLKRVANATGLRFEFVYDEWATLLDAFKNKSIDLLPATYHTDERSTFGLYSEPYFFMREFVYVKADNTDVKSIDDLANSRIAVVKGYGTIPKIRARYPDATIIETSDLIGSINAVLNEEVAALIEAQMAVEYTIKSNAISGLRGISRDVFQASPIHFFSRMDEPLLQSILQKGLNSITEEDERSEIEKWISSTKTERDKLGLSTDQQAWLNARETIRLGVDASWPPIEFVDEDGNYAGVSSGYVDTISKRLEITMKAVPDIIWSEVIEKIKTGELDVLPAVARTPEREKFLNFTKPYIKIPIVIATLKDGPIVGEIGDLEGKRIGVIKSYATAELLRAEQPMLKLVEMVDVTALLKALMAGEVDAVIDGLWGISYEEERLGLDDVKIAAPTPYSYELSMGVRKDWPELVPILDKALASLDIQETTAIKNAWMAVQVSFGLDMKTVLIWAAPIVGGLALIIIAIVLWNRRLGKEISERKAAELKIRAMSDASHDAMIMIDNVGLVMFWNSAAEQMFGYTSKEAMGQNVHHVFAPEEVRESAAAGLRLFAKSGEGPFIGKVVESTALQHDGQKFPVEIAISSFQLDGNWHAVGSVRDITERKKAERIVMEAKEKVEAAMIQLSKSEVKYRELVENASSIIIKLDVEGNITFFNEFAQQFFGFSSEEVLGQSIVGTIVAVKDSEGLDLNNLIQDVINQPELYEKNENENVCKNGDRVWVSWTNRAIRSTNQNLVELLCIGTDITERRKAEKERDEAFAIITSSINYATNIQQSILPATVALEEVFSEHFILWEPRDRVGGDVYFFKPWGLGKIFALGDCTGHGVPGAFMTMISNGAMEMATTETQPGDSATLLQRTHQLIKNALGQQKKESKSDDGLDLGLCYIAPRNRKIVFSGARFSLFIVENEKVKEIKGNKKYGLGYRATPHNVKFSNVDIKIDSKCTYYMTSDGLLDQVGGPKRRGFGKKRFKKLLLEMEEIPMNQRADFIKKTLANYQGTENRRDDVSLVGFSFGES